MKEPLDSIPEDWVIKPAHQIFKRVTDGTHDTPKKLEDGIPLVTSRLLKNGKILLSDADYFISQEDYEAIFERSGVEKWDILYSMIGTIGEVAIVMQECPIFSIKNVGLFKTGGNRHLAEYVAYWMQSSFARNYIQSQISGTSQKYIPLNLLRSFPIVLPPRIVQENIVTILSLAKKTFEARLREVALERERKAALMEHLFTHGTRGEATKQTEIGEMPEGWQVVKLGEVVASTQYGLSVCGNSEGNHPILRMNCLVEGRVNDSNLQFVDLTKSDFENFRLNKGDILFNRTNSSDLVGKTGLFNLDGDFVFASYLIRIAVDKNHLSPEFINYYINMNSTQTRLRMLASRGVSQSNINATKLKGFLIPLPQFPEQQAIASILKACDSKIAALDHEARLLQELFRAMLEELMSGRLPAGALVEDAA